MTDRITGKTIVITGAARGIGYATARALLDRGARWWSAIVTSLCWRPQ